MGGQQPLALCLPSLVFEKKEKEKGTERAKGAVVEVGSKESQSCLRLSLL